MAQDLLTHALYQRTSRDFLQNYAIEWNREEKKKATFASREFTVPPATKE